MTDWKPALHGTSRKAPIRRITPYDSSLIGEYARLFLLLLIVPLVICFANGSLKHQAAFLCLVASLIVLGTLLTSHGYQMIRVVVVGLMTANVFAFSISPDDISGVENSGIPDWSVFLLLLGLAVALAFETVAWISSSTRAVLLKALAWGILLIPAMIYVVAIPAFDSLWSVEVSGKKPDLNDPNWNLVNEAAFRTAKLAVFGVFTYLGACLGSFLNVAAYCIPRGEPIGLRDSQCPNCSNKISRIDNLPIFSYVNLGGKCRSCSSAISPRYLIVEIVAAFIFGSLFLYELVTGCNNVPLMDIHHEGILWIILYPKWPAIGIYLFHCFFMCAMLVLALMEWDQQPLKRTFAITIGLGFIAAAVAYLPLHPVPLFEHLPGLSIELSPWVDQLLKVMVGGVAGLLFGRVFGVVVFARKLSILTFAFCLTGVVLGWQALLQVSTIFLVAATICRCFSKTRTLPGYSPTVLLLIAIVLHHPFWKSIADLWRSN
ncbi:A24 family peptidase [Mariniblastus fucicola]|uniref:A24 family peptidase n=1 Tax=Mariniblastus fucicola TaxID=980251 RepID=UPI0012FA9711|nr:prepilin peptidase [Mariniblastus fucicola]